MKLVFKALALSLILLTVCFSQPQHKIMSYNLLNYPADTTARNPYFRIIFSAIQPEVLVVQEVTSQVGVTGFLNKVLNTSSTGYSAGTFIDGFDTDNAIFYQSSLFQFISNTPLHTALRDINEFKLVYIPTGDTLRIFSVHLKASSGSDNEAQRAAEVAILRTYTNALPSGSNFIVCGDFNIYGSTEQAYQNLVSTSGTGYFIDPWSFMTGSWSTASYSHYHTQSPRVREFGGGSTGGMDDRFDLMLMSPTIIASGGITYITGTHTAYGNDGNHFNDSINQPPNTAVGQQIADALHYASDHIPVYSTFSFAGAATPQLSLTALIEAEYNGTAMTADSVTVELRTASSPYALVEQITVNLNSSGQGTAEFHIAANSVPYYLVVKHRNGIETWSASTVTLSSGSLTYDFTTASNKAYGNNMVSKNGKWCIYSGDINQDGVINTADVGLVYSANVIGTQGNSITDINKDLYTEIQDIGIVFINKVLGIQKVVPTVTENSINVLNR